MPSAQNAIRVIRENYIPEPNSGCWLWLGPVDKEGHGVLYAERKHYKAHRFSLYLQTPCPNVKLLACHTCDVPGCINPDHLFWGTNADNKADCKAKGRTRNNPSVGVEHHNAKLTEEDVLLIRYSVDKTSILSMRYGVCHQTIRNIQLRRNWRHLS